MWPGPEHIANGGQTSYCTLPMFHPPLRSNSPAAGLGYVSDDGHLFSCKNPAVMQQAFHVWVLLSYQSWSISINYVLSSVSSSSTGQFVLIGAPSCYSFTLCFGRSGSMAADDRQPLANTLVTHRIVQNSNNRLGAVYSALHMFWSARQAAATVGLQAVHTRRDAYSVILFDHTVTTGVTNDFSSSPDQLLDTILPYCSGGGTDFTMALRSAQKVMEENFSMDRYDWTLGRYCYYCTYLMERTPVIIFLSDGECGVTDQTVQTLCRSALRLGSAILCVLWWLYWKTFAGNLFLSMLCRLVKTQSPLTCAEWCKLRLIYKTTHRTILSLWLRLLYYRLTRGLSIRWG